MHRRGRRRAILWHWCFLIEITVLKKISCRSVSARNCQRKVDKVAASVTSCYFIPPDDFF